MKLTVTCPAKINLFLSVGPLDSTGYHPIRSVFQAVSLCDYLDIQPSGEDSFESDWPELPADNTVTKAWRLAREYVELPRLSVSLSKVVPPQSGLGGGSSDAAGLLRGLVKVTNGKFSMREAHEVARAVGSDVPFFLTGGLASAEGYGEILTPLDDAPTGHLVIVMPDSSVCTTNAYAELDKTPRALKEFPAERTAIANDFLEVAPEPSRTALNRLKSWGTNRAGMTGSGAAVFGFFESETAARDITRLASREGIGRAWACHTLTRQESLWTS